MTPDLSQDVQNNSFKTKADVLTACNNTRFACDVRDRNEICYDFLNILVKLNV